MAPNQRIQVPGGDQESVPAAGNAWRLNRDLPSCPFAPEKLSTLLGARAALVRDLLPMSPGCGGGDRLGRGAGGPHPPWGGPPFVSRVVLLFRRKQDVASVGDATRGKVGKG